MSLLIQRAEITEVHGGVASAFDARVVQARTVDARPVDPGIAHTRSVDVRIADGVIVECGSLLRRPGETVIDAAGAALLPGLHDHHVHLGAWARALESLDLAPASGLAACGAPEWTRAVGYDDTRHGPLDAATLDRWTPDRPVRVQHRSGHLWVLNTAAVRRLHVDAWDDPGVELDSAGEPTGRLFDLDDRLARAWSEHLPEPPPALAPVAAALTRFGVTAVMDATPDDRTWPLLAAARADGTLPQWVSVMGARVPQRPPHGLDAGPVKIIVSDHHLPTPDELAAHIDTAHRAGRPVAIHCVTRVAAVLCLLAWEQVGSAPGDRLEHGAVLPDELVGDLAAQRITVVTQPAFLWERGDRYLAEVDPDDQPLLYRCGSLLAAGVPVGASTDAPFGPADPWRSMVTAVDRRSASGAAVVPAEAVSPAEAIDRFLTPLDDPGGAPRRVGVGARADLCLLDVPRSQVERDLDSRHVALTFIDGHPL